MSGYRFRGGAFLFFLVSILLSATGAEAAPTVSAFKINNGAARTVNPTVTLPNVCAATSGTTLAGYMASESSDFTSATWRTYASVPMFTLSSGSGEKAVYFKVKNSAGEESAVVSDAISLVGTGLSVVSWGKNDFGQCTDPESNSGFVSVAVGWKHNVGLKPDGTIVAWGHNDYHQIEVPSSNSGFVVVGAGAYHSLGIKSDGSVVAWGRNSEGQCNVPSPNSGFVAVAAGYYHSVGLKSDGSVVAWGSNQDYNGNYSGQCVVPAPNSGFVAVSAGLTHTLGLKADGSIVAWGTNRDWLGNDIGLCVVPSPNSGFVAIASGYFDNLALKSDGSIVTWGITVDWERKNINLGTVPSPNSGFVAIASGPYHHMGLKSDGSITAWGRTAEGQCTIPAPNSGYATIAGGGLYHSVALVPLESVVPVVSSFSINNGAARTVNPTVTLPNVCAGATASSHFYMASESSDFTSATWKPYASVPMFTLSSGSGEKTVYFKVKNSAGVESAVVSDSIQLDSPGAVVAWGSNYNWDGSVYTGQCNIPSPNRDYVAVAAGWGHSAALKVDGSIVTWGYNQFGQCNVPSPNRDFVAVAAVDYQTLGLKSDGSIVVWGYNNSGGQSAVPAPNRDYVAISAVRGHSLALKSDGSVVAWGINTSGQCNVPSPNTGFVAVSAGFRHSLALKADGSVLAWGADQDYYNPQYTGLCAVPAPNSGFRAVSAGGGLHNLGLKSDGSVVAWGSDYDWLGQYIGACAVPAPNSGFVAVSGGNYHSLGLKSDGSIVAWGKNNNGECNVPAPNSGFTAIVGGGNHSLALVSQAPLPPVPVVSSFKINNGAAKTVNPTVTLPNVCAATLGTTLVGYMASESPDFTNAAWLAYAPVPMFTLSSCSGEKTVYFKVKNSAGGESAVVSDTITRESPGRVVAWGKNNDNGQVSVPTNNEGFVEISAGWTHSAGLKSDGSIVAWGLNDHGISTVPSPNRDFVAVSAGAYHTLGLKSDGSIVAWGVILKEDRSGYDPVTTPTPNSGFVAISTGMHHCLGLKADGSVVAWGLNDKGQTTLPVPNSGFVAIAAGVYHSLGLKSDGSVVGWGSNLDFQGNPVNQCQAPLPNSGFVSIAAGQYHSLGLKSDGSVVAWGSNTDWLGNHAGQCEIPPSTLPFVSIARGSYHSLGVKSDGSAVAWGWNEDYRHVYAGQCDVPSVNGRYVAVAGGGYHSLGLVLDNRSQLAVVADPTSGGTVSKSPDLASYTPGTVVTLQATPAAGWLFVGWMDGTTTVSTNVSYACVVGSSNKTITAKFEQILLPDEITVNLPGNVPLTLIQIPAGSFQMGSPDSERSHRSFEGPVHTVHINYPFYMGKYELTQGQWQAIMGDNPAAGYGTGVGDNYPVNMVFLENIRNTENGFLRKLNDYLLSTGQILTPMRLPSEAEWEYACRGGTQTRFYFGDSLVDASGNPIDDLNQDGPAGVLTGNRSDYMWWSGNSGGGAKPVGTKRPNQFGLYDMHGNVSEWVLDTWSNDYTGAPTDGSAWINPDSFYPYMLRGGSWEDDARYCRSASRFAWATDMCMPSYGFRLLMCPGNSIPKQYALSISVWGSGSVTKSPDLATYTPGTVVTLQATPAPGWSFVGWMDGVSTTTVSTSSVYMYTVGASDTTFTARFVAIPEDLYALTLDTDPVNGGAVSKNPDFSTYAPGTSVTLQATPAAGWVFAGWWDGNTAVSSGAFFLYSMPASSKVLTARFLPDYSYVLTLASDPADGGALSKNPDFPTYAPGTSVTLLAIPAAGWAFASWWDGISTVSTDSVFTYTMPAVNKVLTAHFRPHYGSSYTLTLVSDPVNGGTVSKSPDHPSYTPGDPVTLWATPASGWAFAGWWDGTTTVSRSASYTHTVGNSDQTIIARFVKVPDSYRLTVIADPADMGTVMKDPDLPVYAPGTQVTLTAQANAGYCFDRWTGDVSVTSKRTNPVTITMDSDRVVGVEFLPGSQPPAAVLAFSINNGAIMTANPTVTLPNTSVGTTSVTELTHYMVSESADFTSATWQPYARVPMFTLSSGSGVKTVYFKVMDSLGAESVPTSDTIQLGGDGYSIVGWGDNSWGNNEFGQNSVPAPNSGFLACAAGYAHSLGLKSDGSIVAWGSNGKGQCNVSVPNSGFIAVAAGGSHSLGLRSNGSIAVWGNNEFNQWAIPVPNNGFVAVAAGLQHCVGLKSNGSVVVWGNNEVNQCAVPTPNRDFVAITAGYFHTLALKSDGSIVTWGDGKRGECSVPSPNANFVSIGAGAFHSLGVKSNGSITAFGLNGAWQCLVPDLNNGFMAVSGGLYHSLGLKSDGTLVPWGSNLYHQGDIPNSNIRFEAIFAAVTRSLALVYEIGTLTVTLETPEAVAAGAQWRLADEAPGVWHNSGETITPQVGVHTVTFKNVYGWLKPADQQIDVTGTGTAGVSGLYTRSLWRLSTACSNGSIQVSPAGTHFPYGTRVTLTAQPQTGYGFDRWTGDVPTELKRTNPVTLVMDSDRAIGVEFEEGRPPASAVLAFSINNGAILTANPTVTLPNTSVGTTSVTELTHYMVSESADFTSAIWQPYARVPMFTLSSGSGVKTVYFKVRDSLGAESAPTSDTIQLGGTGYPMVGWGDNSWGNNEFGQNSIPAPNSGFLACAAGYAHSLGLKSDGSIGAWGSNAEGQCNVPSPNSGFVAVAAGAFHNLGLKSDGSIVAWGSNEYGQLVVPAPNAGFVAVAAGLYHSVGLKSDGSIVVWGNNGSYQCNGPEPNGGFVAIVAGDYHTVALKSDGSIVAWGDGRCSECLVPSPNTDFVNIGVGAYHSLGVKSDGAIVAFGLNTSGQCRVPASEKDFVAASGGVFHSLGLKSDGTLVPWGSNLYHQGDIPNSNIRFEAISAAVTRSLALVYEVGTLTVTLGTPEAVAAGAQWRLTDEAPGVWHNSGETITPQVGSHTLTFKKVYDWAKPADQPIEITAGGYVKATGRYTWSPWFVNTPPSITSLNITPVEPRTSDLVTPVLQAMDAENDAIVAYRYEWVLDGTVRSTDAVLSPDLTVKGQVWTLRVWAQDAQGQWSVPEALTFTIFNSPPTQPIVQVVPQPTRPDQDLIVDVLVYSTDPDGDAVKYDFKWYKSVDHGRTWIHKVELDGSPQVSQNFINPGELWDVFYTPYEVNSTSALQALPEEYTAASRPAGFAVAQAATRSELKAMTAWDRSYVGENAPPEFRFDAIQTQWTTEGLQLSVNWTALDGDGEAMKVDLSWTDLEYSGLVAVGSGLPGELGRYSALVHPTPGKPFYLHAAVSDTKGAVTQVITGQVNLSGLQVTNQSASEVKETAAVLNGTLSSTDGQDAEVRVYWGRTDGGQEPLVWEHVETLGARSEGAFSVQLTGLLPGTRYLYRCAAKSELGEVWADSSQAFDTGLALPTSVTAVGNTYQVLLTWNAVANAAGYAVERTPQGTVDATPAVWTVGTVTEFADDSAVPGVVYAYTVKTVDWQGNVSAPSEPVSASVTAEEIAPAAYKVVAKGYAMTRDLPTTGSLTFAAEKGARPGTIKIASLKRVPANAQDDPERGIYYLKNCTQLPTLAIQGDVKTLAFDVPVYSLEAKGEVRSVSARSVTFLKAGAFEKIMLTATKPSDEGFYARTFIETEGASQVPILIKATGAVVEELASTGKTAQPVKLLDVASKVYRNGAQTKVSLGAVGSLPRVVAEVSGTVAPQSEATPSSIRGSELKSVTVAGGPIVADEIVGGLEKMTAAGGNIRCALIQSDTNLTLLQATAKKGVGGAIGTAGKPGAMAVKAQTQGKGKNKAAITKVSGQAGVSGYFYAGYNPETGQPTHSGGIGMLQTKAPAGVEGAVFLDPDQVKKMKVSPESPLLAINPDL